MLHCMSCIGHLTHAHEVARSWLGWAFAVLLTLATSGTQAYVPSVLAPMAASLPDVWLDATATAEYDATISCEGRGLCCFWRLLTEIPEKESSWRR